MPRLSNEKHEAFAQSYCRVFKAKRAAVEAGFTEDHGEHLMAMPAVIARIREVQNEALDSTKITAERVMMELARVAFSDVRKCFDDAGNLLPIKDIDPDTAASLAGIDHDVRYEKDWVEETDLATGEVTRRRRVIEVRTAKIKRFSKDAALGALAKHFKLVGDEGDGVNALASALADRLKTARKRATAKDEAP